ncbi:glycine dehydrogenase subunit 1 [Enterococcus sp. DIV0840]|uniref:aminomethyl-transferring glycine dehydrogenase subunit GcvPA n=1 Tax=Enterococcus TaxID=1350 RepID=UPI001A909ED5|nr:MULTISPECIES: aminomethyl-transferring glycine dehydrogenase subunit GcvPA [Enterococcus]MBO0434764.1 aminomethyl-transferring glycine dehydrogenase subunit GcvPA [Enterococcus sp. DIV0849a]MBO0473154.1 aminomethyl-transferring glycine dehydrogenase subunit GcvPA [Enterococcus ureasiticus]
MGNYLGSTEQQQQEMLKTIGLKNMSELYEVLPKEMIIEKLDIPAGKSEFEVRRILENMGKKNKVFSSIFRGAGAYNHYIPAIVKQVSAKEEFMTSYTPYQPEISQGLLQSIFEYQTMICEITGMDATNASVYDGATAAAEAINMCLEKKRLKVLISETTNPMTIQTALTYFSSREIEFVMIPEKDGLTDLAILQEKLDDASACFIVQQPNYYGGIEPVEAIAEMVHEAKAKFIMSVNPVASTILKTAGEVNADIAVGDSQPFGLPLAFGGPYIGFIATKEKLMRKLPGRIAGETVDEAGDRAFVLTLQAREQHIRREKAASNICSNQALCALTNAVYMSTMGARGIQEVAEQCYSKAHYLADQLGEIKGVKRKNDSPFFHEFVTSFPVANDVVLAKLEEHNFLGGYPTKQGLLWCVTEMNTKEQIDQVVELVKEVCA